MTTNTIANGSKPTTFEQAEELGAYSLAALWADRMSWPMPGRSTAPDELAELACMSALAYWLERWQAIPIHRAILAGAHPEAVAAALGGTVEDAFTCWYVWATEQRTLTSHHAKLGIAPEDYKVALEAFAAAGVVVQ